MDQAHESRHTPGFWNNSYFWGDISGLTGDKFHLQSHRAINDIRGSRCRGNRRVDRSCRGWAPDTASYQNPEVGLVMSRWSRRLVALCGASAFALMSQAALAKDISVAAIS